MLRAVQGLAPDGIQAVFTRLGENVTDPAEADAVAAHYLEASIAYARSVAAAASRRSSSRSSGSTSIASGAMRTCARWPSARTPPATTCGSTWSSRPMST